MFFARRIKKSTTPAPVANTPHKKSRKPRNPAEIALANSTLYQFKRNVLDLVARMNQGVSHVDCEVIKRQTMFIQTQLLHSLANDPFLPEHLKIMLMEYHAKSIRATLSDRRGKHLRQVI